MTPEELRAALAAVRPWRSRESLEGAWASVRRPRLTALNR